MKKLNPLNLAILSLFFFCSSSGATEPLPPSPVSDEINYTQLFTDVAKKVHNDYIDPVTDKQVIEGAINGMLTTLDPHSAYLDREAFKETEIQTKGEFGGLGIEITIENSLVKVVAAIEDTPAANAGVKSGDYISAVDGTSTVGLDIMQVVSKLRGKPGTKVVITVLRRGESGPLEFQLKRDVIKVKAVRYEAFNNIGYIKINSFTKQTGPELKNAILELNKNNKMTGLVIDLRNNPGGLLDQALEVSDDFLDQGVIVSIKGRNKNDIRTAYASKGQLIDSKTPIALLINEGSASASEIVAGALQDHKRAILLGTRSFGKGSVQSVIPMADGTVGIRMTIARYYTPSDRSIQAKGIEPDINIEQMKAKFETEKGNSVGRINEASLENHLKVEGDFDKMVKKAQDEKPSSKSNIDLYNKDYLLARAIDLLTGIIAYNKR